MDTHPYYTSNKYYTNTNFYLAAYLFAKGMELVNIDRSNPRSCQFIFIDIPERESLIEQFNFARENSPETTIDARKLIIAIKTLKEKLYQLNN